MKIGRINFNSLFLSYVLVFLIIIAGAVSYARFMVYHDYVVEYEGTCEPLTEQCFVGCEDDACSKEYYYSKVHKYEPDLYAQCGKDITDCGAANVCFPGDRDCSVTFCNSEVDGDICDTVTEDLNIQNVNQVPQEDFLQDTNTSNI
jgi:hypothetical protein